MHDSSLDRLFRPQTVALIGASKTQSKVAGRPLHFLKKHGFSGKIWPVNPSAEKIGDIKCYRSIDALPGVPDTAIVLLPADQVVTAIRALRDIGTSNAIILSGGFAEMGPGGFKRQNALINSAGKMRLLGPNTIGLLNISDGITLSASGALDTKNRFSGDIAIVSQSGGILGSLLSRGSEKGIGFSSLVATGNEVDIDTSDIMYFLANDPATNVIALYLETIRKPMNFRNAAETILKQNKRLVVYKVGRSEPGIKSAISHTGALAGEDLAFTALFKQIQAFRVDRFTDLLDVAMGLSTVKPLSGPNVGILTTTGGAAGLVADLLGLKGFRVPDPSPKTTQELSALLQNESFNSVENPIDLTLAGLDPNIFYNAIITLAKDEYFDLILVVVGSSSIGRPRLLTEPITRAAKEIQKPIVVYTSPYTPQIVLHLNSAGVPTFDSPEACAETLFAKFKKPIIKDSFSLPFTDRKRRKTAPDLIEKINGPQNEAQAKMFFREWGIPIVREIVITNPKDAKTAAANIGEKVVIKILSRSLLHKTEVGAVYTNVSAESAERICNHLEQLVISKNIEGFEGFLIQEQVSNATEILIGYHNDPSLGPSLILGAGGIQSELYDDTGMVIFPALANDIQQMLFSLKIAKLLKGYRGKPAADIPNLIEIILRFADMCGHLKHELLEVEINPLMVLEGKGGVKAADGLLVLREK